MEVSAVLMEPAVDGEAARACQLWKGIDSLETEATRSNSMAVPLRTITMTDTAPVRKDLPEGREHRNKYSELFFLLLSSLLSEPFIG